MNEIEDFRKKIELKYFTKQRKSLSLRFGFLVPLILVYREIERKIQDFNLPFASSYSEREVFDSGKNSVLIRHSSPLLRKLGTDKQNEILQKSKITNLEIASAKMNGLIVKPGEIFSFWTAIGGKPTRKKGYKEGILLSRGKVVPGIGGGLCQLSNLLYWMILHSELEVLERHHHSLDVFKDSGRTLPFGTGATIFYPTLDLRFKNNYDSDIIINITLTETQLVGKFLMKEKNSKYKFHIYGTGDTYLKYKGKFFRYNKVYREKLEDGEVVSTEFLYENLFPTMYEPESFLEIDK